MGPVIICDKSTLQALNRDELNALRRYYSLNVPPVLLVEILGDLKKHANITEGREEVRVLANKLVPACSSVNTNFRKLIRGELAGHKLPMDGRPVLIGGQQVVAPEGKKGVIFEISEEAKALLRWQTDEFHSAEELMAEAWRLSTQAIDLESMQRQLRGAYSGQLNLRTLAGTAQFVDDLMRSAPPELLLAWFLPDVGLFSGREAQAIEKFHGARQGSLSEAAPYTAYCIRVALIFHFALTFSLVSTRPTNRIDLEYLYYAPFCNAFSSGDTFHRKTAPLVLRGQSYVDRDDLKADLGQLAQWWAGLNPQQQADESRISGPPENDKSVTHQLWKKTMRPGYRDPERRDRNLPQETSARMLKEIQRQVKEAVPSDQPFQGSMEDCDFIVVKHSVRLNGPCICGSDKMFKDCCGRGIAASHST